MEISSTEQCCSVIEFHWFKIDFIVWKFSIVHSEANNNPLV